MKAISIILITIFVALAAIIGVLVGATVKSMKDIFEKIESEEPLYRDHFDHGGFYQG